MNKIKRIISSSIVLLGLIVTPIAVPTVTYAAAIDAQQQVCEGSGGKWAGGTCTGNSKQDNLTPIITTIVNVLIFIVATLAVIMIIVGALRYVTSAGNATSVKSAKDTILYSVVGLVIAILAYAIVNFVIKAFVK